MELEKNNFINNNNESYYSSNEQNGNDKNKEYEEDEINSDEYISSSMLDVDTNTYINLTHGNNSNIKIINEDESKENKRNENINIKDNNKPEDIAIKTIIFNKNNKIIHPHKLYGYNNKVMENKNMIKVNEANFSLNINNKKSYIEKDNNCSDIKKYNSLLIKKKNDKFMKYNNLYNSINNNHYKLNSFQNEEFNSCFLNENLLKDLLLLKQGQRYKILRNSQSIKNEKTQGRLSTSNKIDDSNYINKSNINLLKKMQKNNCPNNLEENNNNTNTNINNNNRRINPISNPNVYVKKLVKNINNRENDSPFNKKLKINTSIINKKLDFLNNNNKIKEESIGHKNKNLKEIISLYKNENREVSKDKNKIDNKSKSIGKEIKIRLKNEMRNCENKKIKKIDLSIAPSKNRIRKLRCFNSFFPKYEDKTIIKFLNNEQFLTYSNINNMNTANNRVLSNNSEFVNKSLDVKKMNDLSNKKQKKSIKQRRNLSTDINFISNNINNILYKSLNKKISKEQHSYDKKNILITRKIKERNDDYLFPFIKTKVQLTNKGQNRVNNSKFNLRNNLFINISKKYNKNRLNEMLKDKTFNYTLISKNNKSIDNNDRNKNNGKSLLENSKLNNSSNKKVNNENIYKNIMKSFYGRNIDNSNVHYHNLYGNNMKARKTDYKYYNKYNITNNFNSHINNININTSNNLINLITNITTNEDFQSFSGNNISIQRGLSKTGKNYIKNKFINSNSSYQNRKIKKSQINDNLSKLTSIDSFNKKNSLEKSYLTNKFIKNHYQRNNIINIKKSKKSQNKNLVNFNNNNKENNNKRMNDNNNIISNSFRYNSNDKKKPNNNNDKNLIKNKLKKPQIFSERNNNMKKFCTIKYDISDNKYKKNKKFYL